MSIGEFITTTYSLALPVILGYIVYLLKERDKRDRAKDDATKCLLRVQLIEYYEKYHDEESVPSYVFDNWTEMFKDYETLGGNGTVAQMNQTFKKHTIEHGGHHDN